MGSGPATMALVEEQQEEEGAVGAGRLLPRYAVGSEIEVQMTDRGFHGAYYEAIVTARIPDSGGYEVVYSTLIEDGGGRPLREAVAPANVRPRPPPPPPPGAARCDLNVFDMVEAYHNEGWWPGVVSGAWPASTVGEPRYAVSLPTVPAVLDIVASLVRPRRAFVRGRWMDMQQVVPRVPLYDEGSNVEVICPEGKQGMMTATIIKMVGSANYVVQHGDSNRSIVVLHSRYIRPQPVFDRMKFYYDLEPSTEVEVYRDGTWLPGVISEIGSCESSKYAVRVKKHNNADEEDYTLVSSTFLRPCCEWDGQQWRLSSTKAFYQLHNKHARKRKYTLSVENSLSPVFSTPCGDSVQNSFVRNRRMRTDNVRNEGPHMRHSLHPNQVTTGSSSKDDIDVEAPADKHTTTVKKLDNKNEPKGKGCMTTSNMVLNMSCTHGDGKRQNCLTKAFANMRGNDKSLYLDVVEISDSSGYSDGIEIDDSSSCNPARRSKRWQIPTNTGDGLCSRIAQLHQESSPNSAHNNPSNQCVLLPLGLEEASHVPSNNEGVQLTPLSGYPILGTQPLQVLPALNERKELSLSDHVCSEAEPVSPYDSTARAGIQEMCQEVTKANILLADDCNEVPDTFSTTSGNSKQSICDPLHAKARSIRRSRNSEVPISLKVGSSSSSEQVVKFLPSEQMEVPERCEKTHDVAFDNTRGNDKSSYFDIVDISETSGYGDGSSICNPNKRRKRRQSLTDTEGGLHSRIVQLHQESSPKTTQNTPSNQNVLLVLGLVEASHVPSNAEGLKLTPLSCYPVLGMQPLQVLPALNERKELPLSDHVCSEAETVAPYDSTARDDIHEMCQEVTKAKILLADSCNEVADTFSITSENSKRSICDQLHAKASSMTQRSRNSEVLISLKIRSSSSAEQFLSSEQMEVPKRCKKTHTVMGMLNNISSICVKEEDNLMNCKPCPNSEGTSSLAHPGRTLVYPNMTMDLSAFMPAPNSNGLPPGLITSSLLLRPRDKMEVFTRLPQKPHFSKLLQDCHPEFREGNAIGLAISFANLAESIQNMRIQDEDQLFQGKMSSLVELEENGFEVAPLKERLGNLLRIKNRQMDLKGKKEILEQDILEKEGAYVTVEREEEILDMGIKQLEQMLLHAQEEKALLVEQKKARGLEISKLQIDACRAEELYMSVEADFGRTATAPWEACLPTDNTASGLVFATTTCSI